RFTLRAQDAAAKPIVIETQPQTITVRSVLDENAAAPDPAELKPVTTVAPPKLDYLTPSLIAGGSAAVLLAGVVLLARRPKPRAAAPAPESVPRVPTAAPVAPVGASPPAPPFVSAEICALLRPPPPYRFNPPAADETAVELAASLERLPITDALTDPILD